MVLEHHSGHFRLEITSLEEFAVFVAIIRADDLDDDRINALTTRLNRKSAALKTAEQGAEEHGKSHT